MVMKKKGLEQSKISIDAIDDLKNQKNIEGNKFVEDKDTFERIFREIEASDLPPEDKKDAFSKLKEQYERHFDAYNSEVKEKKDEAISDKQKEIEGLKETKEEFIKVTEKLKAAGFLTETGDVSGAVDSTTQKAAQIAMTIQENETELEAYRENAIAEAEKMAQSILRR